MRGSRSIVAAASSVPITPNRRRVFVVVIVLDHADRVFALVLAPGVFALRSFPRIVYAIVAVVVVVVVGEYVEAVLKSNAIVVIVVVVVLALAFSLVPAVALRNFP